MKLVSIIVLNFNGKDLLERCLDSIKENTSYPNYEVIVVDNGSTDGSQAMVEKRYRWVKLIKNKENLGFAKGNNIGIRAAEGDYILLLNNDTIIIQKDWLNNMVATAEEDPRIGIVGCRLITPDGTIQHVGGWFNIRGTGHYVKDIDRTREVDYVTGTALLIKREVINKIGLLDENFSPAYYEDTDWCARCKKAGYKVVCTHKSTIIHVGSATAGRYYSSDVRFYIENKNRLRFTLLNYPLLWLIARIPNEIGILIYSIITKRSSEIFRAYRDNLKNIREILSKRRER
ncbi:MAG: glycosyltransferase family 2 protein [candidate division WOR-3 bacterium]